MIAAIMSADLAPAVPTATVRPAAAHRPDLKRTDGAPDWAGRWFDLVEETSGEYVGMRGGRLQSDGSISWTFVPHASYDGLGGFVNLLRYETGRADIAIPVRKSRQPTWLQRAGAVLRLVAQKPRAAAAWKSQDPAFVGQPGERRPGTAVAAELFDAARTRRLNAMARAAGVSVNSLLLSALARASRPELGDGPAIWMMPVNMRGPVMLERDTANHTGYLQLDMSGAATPAQAQEEVREGLRRREHWASWLFLNLGRIAGYGGMRRIYRFQMSRFGNRPFVGAFSNLGNWDGHGQWYVCPPVTMTCPVASGAIVCDGRLSLTLEAHPSIAGHAAFARTLMARWLAELGV